MFEDKCQLCRTGWTPYNIEGKQYCFMNTGSRLAVQAQSACSYLEAEIPLPLNDAENAAYLKIFQTLPVSKMVDSEVNAHAAKNAILGLNDVKKENEWMGTYTGKKVTYFNWNQNEPNNSGNEDYVVMIASGATAGKWNDVPSSYSSMNIICQAACPDGKLFDVFLDFALQLIQFLHLSASI